MKTVINLQQGDRIKNVGIYEYNGRILEITEKNGGKYTGECMGKRFRNWDISGVYALLDMPYEKRSRKAKMKAEAEDVQPLQEAQPASEAQPVEKAEKAEKVEKQQKAVKNEEVPQPMRTEAEAAQKAAEEAQKKAEEAAQKAEALKAEAEKAQKAAEEAAEAARKKAEEEAQKAAEEGKKVIRHRDFDMIKNLVAADIPVYLYGPAGTGKNVVCQQIAHELGLEFYFSNSISQEYKIVGFVDAGGRFHETEFYRAFKYGGLHFLDEIDCSIPEVFTLLNAAIANRYFVFANNEKVTAHPNFRVIAAGNTCGTGATEEYNGRTKLDAASLDRFLVHEFTYDSNIEKACAGGNDEILEFCREARKAAAESCTSMIVSYRCIGHMAKLEKIGMPAEDIVKMAVTKGIPADDISTISACMNCNARNKFAKVFKKLGQI